MNRILAFWTLLFLLGLMVVAIQHWKVTLAVIAVVVLFAIVGIMVAVENEQEASRRAKRDRKREVA